MSHIYATALPMQDGMIEHMNKLPWKQKMSPQLIFVDQNLNIFEDDESDDYEHDANDGKNEFNWSEHEETTHMMMRTLQTEMMNQ